MKSTNKKFIKDMKKRQEDEVRKLKEAFNEDLYKSCVDLGGHEMTDWRPNKVWRFSNPNEFRECKVCGIVERRKVEK